MLCAAGTHLLGQEISIGVDRWAKLLRVRPMTVSRWREWSVEDGNLSCGGNQSNLICPTGPDGVHPHFSDTPAITLRKS